MTRTITLATLCLAGLTLVGVVDAFAQDEREDGKSNAKSIFSLHLRQLEKPKLEGTRRQLSDSLFKRLKFWRPSQFSVDPDMVIRPDPSLHFEMPVVQPRYNVDPKMVLPGEQAWDLLKRKLKH